MVPKDFEGTSNKENAGSERSGVTVDDVCDVQRFRLLPPCIPQLAVARGVTYCACVVSNNVVGPLLPLWHSCTHGRNESFICHIQVPTSFLHMGRKKGGSNAKVSPSAAS